MLGVLVGEGVTSELLEALVKELDAVAAGRDPKSCYWLECGWVYKPWWWLEERCNSKRSLIRQQWLIVPEAMEDVEAEWVFRLFLRRLVYFFLGFEPPLPENSNAKLELF